MCSIEYKNSMYNVYQNTTKNIVTFKGVGLHSGKTSTVRLIPGKENQGILFKRIDLKKHNIIKADYKNVTSATLCSTLSNDAMKPNKMKLEYLLNLSEILLNVIK